MCQIGVKLLTVGNYWSNYLFTLKWDHLYLYSNTPNTTIRLSALNFSLVHHSIRCFGCKQKQLPFFCLQTAFRYHWTYLKIMSICQTVHCLLWASLWLNCDAQTSTDVWTCWKALVLSPPCSLTETDARELCSSPSQGFQLGTACRISSLSQHCTCVQSQLIVMYEQGRAFLYIHIYNELCTMMAAVWHKTPPLLGFGPWKGQTTLLC